MYNPTKNPEDRKIFNKALAVISKYFAGGAGPMAPVVTGHARLAVTPRTHKEATRTPTRTRMPPKEARHG